KEVGANRLRRRRLMRIEQGVLHADRDLGLQRGEAQGDVVVGGQCRANVDPAGECGEAVTRHLYAIRPKGQPLRGESALRVRFKTLSKPIRFADQLDMAVQRQPGGIDDRDMQFAGVALSELARGQQKHEHPVGHAVAVPRFYTWGFLQRLFRAPGRADLKVRTTSGANSSEQALRPAGIWCTRWSVLKH